MRHGDLGDVEREPVGRDDAVVVDAVGTVVHAAPVPLALVLVLGKDLLRLEQQNDENIVRDIYHVLNLHIPCLLE